MPTLQFILLIVVITGVFIAMSNEGESSLTQRGILVTDVIGVAAILALGGIGVLSGLLGGSSSLQDEIGFAVFWSWGFLSVGLLVGLDWSFRVVRRILNLPMSSVSLNGIKYVLATLVVLNCLFILLVASDFENTRRAG